MPDVSAIVGSSNMTPEKTLSYEKRWPGCQAFLVLPVEDRQHLVEHTRLMPRSFSATRVVDEVQKRLRTIPMRMRRSLAERLIEWWDWQAASTLMGRRERSVGKQEVLERISDLIQSLGKAAMSEDDALMADEDLEDRRSRLPGSAETLLEALPTETQPGEAAKVAELREEIESLAAQLDPEGNEQALDAMRLHIGRLATHYLQRLPFAPEYRNAEAALGLKTLQAGIAVESRYIPMRSIGSDENYLSMHVSFALAL
jgi:hypothetical protein